MNNQVNEVLEKIREVCDLKRLEFGCEVVFCYDQIPFYWVVSVAEDRITVTNGTGNTRVVPLTTFVEGKIAIDKAEIIGLPVQLNDLLLALGTPRLGRSFTETEEAGYENVLDWLVFEHYDLQKSVEDNLRSNPELTKWVHGVIIGKE